MTNRERFKAVLDGKTPDRLPMVEWASWWDKTVSAWIGEGMPAPSSADDMFRYFGLDDLRQIWVGPRGKGCPSPAYHGAGLLSNMKDYEEMLPDLYPEESIDAAVRVAKRLKEGHDRGDYAVWYTMEGYFWFPRTLFGIENHLFAFYDEPELMHRMNQDQVNFSLRFLERILPVLTPEFMTFAEDMSYNHGPMLSKALFDEFLLPYYKQVIPMLKDHGVKVLVDTDGDVTPLLPWLKEAGVEGVLPLERMAGVDVNQIRRDNPEWIMIGGYDKTIMHLGEEAMRKEFERLLPAMQSGRYVPGVDHQTPPDVTMENYRIYVRLLEEYARKACL